MRPKRINIYDASFSNKIKIVNKRNRNFSTHKGNKYYSEKYLIKKSS